MATIEMICLAELLFNYTSGATGSSQISSTTGPVTSALWSSSSEKASSPDKTFFSTKPSGI